jgi:excisionase family DNA binding protein
MKDMSFTVRQAAERLGVSPSLVYALVAARRLRHERIGLKRGVIRIPDDAVEEYRRECAVPAETGTSTPAGTLRTEVNLKLKHIRL